MRGPIPGYAGHRAVFIATLLFAVAAVVGGLLYAGAGPDPKGTYRVSAVVPDAGSLTPGGEVRIAGLRAGQVEKITQRGQVAVVSMTLKEQYAPVREDARVGLRLRTLVGENYVELYPGTASRPALPDGGSLPMERALEAPQIDEILSTLDKHTRRRARQLIQGFGQGLDGRGERLNRVLEGLSGTVREYTPVVEVLDKDRVRAATLVADLGTVMQEIAASGQQLRTLVGRSRQTFTAVAQRSDALKSVLKEMPPTLRQIRSTTGILSDVTKGSTPVVSNLARAMADARPIVEELGPAADRTRTAVAELGRASAPVTSVVEQLQETVGPGAASLPKVRAILRQLNPALGYLSPYAKEATAFLANMRSAVNYFDATGHAARVHLVIGPASPTAYSPTTRKYLDQILNSGALSQATSLKYGTYQTPGTMDDPTKFDDIKQYPRITAEPRG